MRKKIIFIAVVAAILGAGVLWNSRDGAVSFGKKDTSWYAVHLANNQVYFGHITSVSDSTVTLADAHFLETYQEATPTATSKSFAIAGEPRQSMRLVRRGDEKILSTDHMLYVNRSVVLYWEKLTLESEIANLLKEAK